MTPAIDPAIGGIALSIIHDPRILDRQLPRLSASPTFSLLGRPSSIDIVNPLPYLSPILLVPRAVGIAVPLRVAELSVIHG